MGDPASVRALIRDGRDITFTSDFSANFLQQQHHPQANIVVLPQDLSKDFGNFVMGNLRPCPLLYHSAEGEVSAGPLATDSDIRTDVPRYLIYREGSPVQIVSQLNPIWDLQPDTWVTFYLGCSFGFDSALLERSVPVRHMVQLATTSSGSIHEAHASREPGDVPVFWACGVTSSMAVASAHLPISITHQPGSMFATDLTRGSQIVPQTPLDLAILQMESFVQWDPANRGIMYLHTPGEGTPATTARAFLTGAVPLNGIQLCLLLVMSLVAPVAAQFCTPAEESDGPPGALTLARVLMALGKRVVIATLPVCAETIATYVRLDDIFAECTSRGIATVGIGDGGNELGMGNVSGQVFQHVPHGPKVACMTSCNFLITAGVSNWGAVALALSVA
eukprot:gene1987-473_t